MSHSTRLLAFAFAACVCVGCGADNATSLADRIGDGASRLSSREAGSSLTVSFDPMKGASPYTLIFFPDRDVPEADLVAAGVDKAIARRIYTDLAYLGGMAGKLVVEQEGERLKFTSSWKRYAELRPPEAIVVSKRKTGPAAIEMRREDGTIRVVAIR